MRGVVLPTRGLGCRLRELPGAMAGKRGVVPATIYLLTGRTQTSRARCEGAPLCGANVSLSQNEMQLESGNTGNQ